MKIDKILEFTKKAHEGQFRNDRKTPYIIHPISVCSWLYILGLTTNSKDEELQYRDYVIYAVALMHDILEDTKVTEQQVIDASNNTIFDMVDTLTCKENIDNPFYKIDYLQKIINSNNDEVFFIKCVDKLCNVHDFIDGGNEKYAKIYFHKADCLWNEVYNRYSMSLISQQKYGKLWNEVKKLNERFHSEKG